MVFTVNFAEDEDIKDEIIQTILENSEGSLKNRKEVWTSQSTNHNLKIDYQGLKKFRCSNYDSIYENYLRCYQQLKNKKIYNFFKYRKPLAKFIKFEILGRLSHTKPYYKYQNNMYILTEYQKCPICKESILEDDIKSHMENELSNKGDVIVLFDSSITTLNNRMVVESCTVKELKKNIYDKMGLSVSKQEVWRGDMILSNSITLKNETVTIKQKRRSNKGH